VIAERVVEFEKYEFIKYAEFAIMLGFAKIYADAYGLRENSALPAGVEIRFSIATGEFATTGKETVLLQMRRVFPRSFTSSW